MQKAGTFFAAMLYGASWIVVLINILAIVATVQEGGNIVGYLPALMGAVIVIVMVHYSAGWFPFRHRA